LKFWIGLASSFCLFLKDMKRHSITLILFTLISFISPAQTVISSQEGIPKYAVTGALNLEENGAIFWSMQDVLSTRKGNNIVQVQYVNRGSLVYSIEAEKEDGYLPAEKFMIATSDGNYSYLVFQNKNLTSGKMSSNESELLVYQISNEGEISKLYLDLGFREFRIESALCSENYAHFYINDYQEGFQGAKKNFENFNPRLINIEHRSGEVAVKKLNLPSIDYKESKTLWQLSGVGREALFYTKLSFYKDKSEIDIRSIDFEGELLGSSQASINREVNNKRFIYNRSNKLVQSANQTPYTNPYALDIRALGLFELFLDTENDRMYYLGQSGTRLEPEVFIDIFDLEGTKVASVENLELSKKTASRDIENSHVLAELHPDGGLVYTGFEENISLISKDGTISSKKLELNGNNVYSIKAYQLYENSEISKYCSTSKSSSLKASMKPKRFKPCSVSFNGQNYLYYFNSDSKKAELLKF